MPIICCKYELGFHFIGTHSGKNWSFQGWGLLKAMSSFKVGLKGFYNTDDSMGTRTGGLWLQRDAFGCQVGKGWRYNS